MKYNEGKLWSLEGFILGLICGIGMFTFAILIINLGDLYWILLIVWLILSIVVYVWRSSKEESERGTVEFLLRTNNLLSGDENEEEDEND